MAQVIERKRLGDHVHVLAEELLAHGCVLGVAGDEKHFQAWAVLTRDLGERRANPYFDLDFYQDHGRSVYRPAITIRQLEKRENFTYTGGVLVHGFTEPASGDVTVFARGLADGAAKEYRARAVLLCAGPVNSARIAFADSRPAAWHGALTITARHGRAVRFGTHADALTHAQLASIRFSNATAHTARLDAHGYLVRSPRPSSLAA